MKALQRAALLGVLALIGFLGSPPLLTAQDTAVLTRQALTDAQIEEFLLTAKIGAIRAINEGVTGARRATLSDGQITHDAHIQTVEIARNVFVPDKGATEINFKDSFRYNIAGYRVARLLGLDSVPVSVARSVNRTDAAVTWWIDDLLMNEGARQKGEKQKKVPTGWRPTRTAGQIHVMRVFDELIANNDRNAGNLQWTADGTMWMIDHTRAFRLRNKLRAPKLLERIDRDLLAGLRRLTVENVTAAVGDNLSKDEIKIMLERRDEIIKHFEEKIAQRKNENLVLYSVERR